MGVAGPRRARWLAAVALPALGLGIATWLRPPVVIPDTWWAVGLALGGAAAAWLAVPFAIGSRPSGKDAADTVSRELDVLSERMLRLERHLDRLPSADGTTPLPIGELVEDIGSLSQVVKDLAETAAGHERAIAELGTTLRPSLAPFVEGEPAPAAEAEIVPSFFPPQIIPQPGGLAASQPRSGAPRHRTTYSKVIDALDGERIELLVQPVVSLPQRRLRLYECFPLLRPDDGEALVPAEFMPVLDRLGQTARLDAMVVERAVAVARGLTAPGRVVPRAIPIACGLSNKALADPHFCATVDRLLLDSNVGGRVVLIAPQRAWAAASADLLARWREAGLALALRDIETADLDPERLAQGGVRYLKLPAALLIGEHLHAGPLAPPAALAVRLAGSDIAVIADGIDEHELVPELIELRVPLAQGYALGLPSPIASIFAQPPDELPGDAKVAGDGEEPPPTPPTDGNRPFRDFLRRAG